MWFMHNVCVRLRAINITPVLVQMPGHMFVGYYTDSAKKNITFLETTMIGDVDLDDYFPDEKLDSLKTGKSQGQMSRLTFEKSKEYAQREYNRVADKVRANKPGYLMVEISKNVRRDVQSIGKWKKTCESGVVERHIGSLFLILFVLNAAYTTFATCEFNV